MRPTLSAVAVLATLTLPASFVASSALSACQETVSQSPCKDIPSGGCPLSHGLACEDPTCAAAYACNPDGTWTLDHACPGYDASAPPSFDAAVEAGAPSFDASGFDAPPGSSGGPGCEALQEPDCPLSTALACPSGCCNCEDLFVCDLAGQGWVAWGTCGPSGLTPTPRRDP